MFSSIVAMDVVVVDIGVVVVNPFAVSISSTAFDIKFNISLRYTSKVGLIGFGLSILIWFLSKEKWSQIIVRKMTS